MIQFLKESYKFDRADFQSKLPSAVKRRCFPNETIQMHPSVKEGWRRKEWLG